jgi:hypothetical protein
MFDIISGCSSLSSATNATELDNTVLAIESWLGKKSRAKLFG